MLCYICEAGKIYLKIMLKKTLQRFANDIVAALLSVTVPTSATALPQNNFTSFFQPFTKIIFSASHSFQFPGCFNSRFGDPAFAECGDEVSRDLGKTKKKKINDWEEL